MKSIKLLKNKGTLMWPGEKRKRFIMFLTLLFFPPTESLRQ